MCTVLVVTGDREVRRILVAMLAEQGTTVLGADDAVEAIARVGALDKQPDLVLVDRRLARDREVELLDSIRSRASLDDVPIVLFAAPPGGSGDPDPGESLREAFDPALVLAIVKAICK
ncbi:MAG TPA: response regulator [Myxococcales bacterium]|jgi:CheY-like chemotaxis protein|nr:response regulator [Myxococcales bacterium]